MGYIDLLKEMREETRQQISEMNRKCGELANKMGTLVEDHNLTIVTGNIRHLSKVPELKVENWL